MTDVAVDGQRAPEHSLPEGPTSERVKPVSQTKVGALMVLSAASLWGTFSLFFRTAERWAGESGVELSAATESFVFFGVVGVLLAPRALRRPTNEPITKEAVGWMVFFSVADALNVLLFFAAMQHTTIAIAVLTHYLAPVFVALFAPRILKEPRVVGIWTTTLTALVGLTMLLEPHRAASAGSIVGAVFGAGSALLYAGAVMSMKRLGHWFSASQMLVWHYPIALLILGLCMPAGQLMSLDFRVLGILVLCGLIPGTIGGLLFVEGVRRIPASRAGVLSLFEPLVAVLLSIVIWGERPGLIAFFGGATVLVAAYRVVTSPTVEEKSDPITL